MHNNKGTEQMAFKALTTVRLVTVSIYRNVGPVKFDTVEYHRATISLNLCFDNQMSIHRKMFISEALHVHPKDFHY